MPWICPPHVEGPIDRRVPLPNVVLRKSLWQNGFGNQLCCGVGDLTLRAKVIGVLRNCDMCGRPYEAKSARSRFCSDLCRVRRSRGAAPPPSAEEPESPLVKATRAELAAAGKECSALGQLALAVAARLATVQTTAGVASLSRELRAVVAVAVGPTPTQRPAPGAGDEIDELKARRDAKRDERATP